VKRYHLTTFGCQMNEHDSERIKGMLESLGYGETGAQDQADLILFNTCSIRETADSRFTAHLGHAKRVKRERPETVIGVGGCSVPVRRCRLRARTGSQAGRVFDQ
jgi:tRNA-2-methylthio-N6-dimethylallyladenosine synthase